MNAPVRTFDAKPAVRESVPLLIGLMGSSGSGKTFSALRLATGIQTVTGGDIYFIDSEARRALHYADQFTFKHVQLDPPFGSLDYLAAIQHCVKQGAKVIVIDSMTHEHSGPGGYLMTQEAEVERMAGSDYAKRERVKMAGWIKPSALRQRMIAGILQLNVNLIFCFRAKEKTKPVKGGGIQELGFMPIAGEELLFEQTVNCLLMPKSGGVPTWRSDQIGEKMMMKLPRQFEKLFADSKPLDEETGGRLASAPKCQRAGRAIRRDGVGKRHARRRRAQGNGRAANRVGKSRSGRKARTRSRHGCSQGNRRARRCKGRRGSVAAMTPDKSHRI
jgi:ABC-type dipeptide/oligopeptide/nickel transport system ATPase subunit